MSSLKLHRDIGVSQKTAWYMLQRIRKAFEDDDEPPFQGPVEADETYIGGKRRNMSNAKRKTLTGRGSVGKTAVVGTKDRASNRVAAKPVPTTDAPHVAGFVAAHTKTGAKVYTDEAAAYNALNSRYDHETVNHSVSEYVRGMAHTNGMESFWAILKRGYQGVYHHMSAKHLHRYVNEFSGRHNMRDRDTIEQMGAVVTGMAGEAPNLQGVGSLEGATIKSRNPVSPARQSPETGSPLDNYNREGFAVSNPRRQTHERSQLSQETGQARNPSGRTPADSKIGSRSGNCNSSVTVRA